MHKEPDKGIDNLIRDLRECSDEGAIEAVEDWVAWNEEHYDKAVDALAAFDIILCPRCEEWAQADECSDESVKNCELLKAKTHPYNSCRPTCHMRVLDCCEFPVHRRHARYEPIDLSGWDFMNRHKNRVAFWGKMAWHRFSKFMGEALVARYEWDRLSRRQWQAGCVAVSVAAPLEEQFNTGRRTT